MESQKALKLMGKKRGMLQIFDERGSTIVCTAIEVEPNVLAQIKTTEKDGYSALQLGFETIKAGSLHTRERRVSRPLLGHYKKANLEPRRRLCETRLENTDGYELGQEFGVSQFSEVTHLDVRAKSKGKGYQGVIKLHGFAGGPASHGSGFHRHAGSTGMRSTPGRCLPNGPRPSHMGDRWVTVQNLKVVKIREEDQVILVKGQVPGPRNGLVYLSPAVKKKTVSKNKKK